MWRTHVSWVRVHTITLLWAMVNETIDRIMFGKPPKPPASILSCMGCKMGLHGMHDETRRCTIKMESGQICECDLSF